MARGQLRFIGSSAVAVLFAAAPLVAQSTNPPPAQAPTPSPAPAGTAVGPPQLRDFNLNGTVTQPAQPPVAAPATPSPTTPSPTPPAEPRATPAPVAATPSPVERRPTVAAPDRNPARDAVTIDLPPAGAAPIAPEPSFAPAPVIDLAPTADAPLAADDSGRNWWPWLAALLALGLGAAFLWSRRQRDGHERYAADGVDPAALVATPTPTPTPAPLPRAAQPAPRPASRAPLPSASPVPTPLPPAAAPTPPPPISGGIVASGLKPKIEFELIPIRAETDGAEGAALVVDILVINRGSAPARDVLVDALLINAGPKVNAEVGRFFTQAAGPGERVPIIPPMASVAIKVRLEVAAAELAPLVIEGRKLLVPLVAINAFYYWGGSELAESASFLVGRGEADGGKMAPFRIDQGARAWAGLAARTHSHGLER